MTRKQPGGYCWRQQLADALQAEADARRHLDVLQRQTCPGSIASHLWRITLDLGTIQEALHQLEGINGAADTTDGE